MINLIINRILILLSITGIASGCESDVNFHGDESSPKMVVNSIINSTDNSHTLKVSESVFIFSDQESGQIKNPNLQLKINNQDKDISFDSSEDQHSYYNFVTVLNPGDKIEISGSTQEHGSVKGEDYVPNPPEIVSVDTEWFTGVADGYSYLRTFVKIKDNPDEKNYYRIVISGETIFEYGSEEQPNSDFVWQLLDVYVDQEILFNNISSIVGENESSYRYRVFPDELFQGEEYTLNVYVRRDRFDAEDFNVRHFIKVQIHSLSENLYLYLHSLELASAEDNFQEPVKVYSNIEGGYGILGIYNIDEKIIEVK